MKGCHNFSRKSLTNPTQFRKFYFKSTTHDQDKQMAQKLYNLLAAKFRDLDFF